MLLRIYHKIAVGLLAAQASAEETLVLKNQKDRESYAIGVEVVRKFKRQGIEIDLDIVIRGVKDALAGEKLLLTDPQILETMNMFASELRRKKTVDRLMAGQDNKKEGEEFLAARPRRAW